MRAMLPRCVLFVALLSVSIVDAGRVKNALFNLFGSSKKESEHHGDALAEKERVELIAWLKDNGFSEYAGHEWIKKFDEDLAYDCIDDFTHIVADEDYEDVDIPKETAIKMQALSRKHMMSNFLHTVPVPESAPAGVYVNVLDALLAAGYDEPEEVADIEEDEAKGLGIEKAHLKPLVSWAEQYDARELFYVILSSYKDPNGGANPFADESSWKPILEALIKGGARSLADISTYSATDASQNEWLEKLKADPRVLQHATKQEL